MTDKKSSLFAGVENGSDKGPWYEGTAGERIAVRLSSTDTNGAYAIVESVAAPGCSPLDFTSGTQKQVSHCTCASRMLEPHLLGSLSYYTTAKLCLLAGALLLRGGRPHC